MHISSLLAATGVLTSAVLAAPAQQEVLGLDLDQLPLSHPDFDLDLDERRLVQFGENKEPVWVTELEKVRILTRRRCLSLTHTMFGRFKPRRRAATSLICRIGHSTVTKKLC